MIFADQSHKVAFLHIRYMCYVHHHLVHTDTAADGGLLSPDQHISLIGKTSGISVSVADGDCRDPLLFLCHIGAAVADLRICRQCFDIDNMRMQRHDRAQRNWFPRDIGGRPETVQCDPSPYQIKVGFGEPYDACTVGGMLQGDPVPQFLFNSFCKSGKAADLCTGMVKRRFIRTGKMCKNTFQNNAAILMKLQDPPDKLHSAVIGRNTDTAHSRVHRDMNDGGMAGLFRRQSEFFQHILPKDRGTDSLAGKAFIAVRKNIPQDQNRLCNARISEFNRLFKGGYRKAPQIGNILDFLCDGCGTVSVTVCLDHGDHGCTRRQIAVHAFHVKRDGGEIDLRADAFFAHDSKVP